MASFTINYSVHFYSVGRSNRREEKSLVMIQSRQRLSFKRKEPKRAFLIKMPLPEKFKTELKTFYNCFQMLY